MRVIGAMMIVVAFILNIMLAVQSNVDFVMDSQTKMGLTMMNANPAMFGLSFILFIGGFALVIFGKNIGLFDGVRHNMRQRKIDKNERRRQEAIRVQSEKHMR